MFRAHPPTVLQHGGGQHAPGHLGHLITHAELELLNKRVCVVVGAPHLQGVEEAGWTKREEGLETERGRERERGRDKERKIDIERKGERK